MVTLDNTIKHIFSNKIIGRRAARVIAVQCLYAIEQDEAFNKTTDEKLLEVISIYSNELSDSTLTKANQAYLIKLVRFTIENKHMIQSHIASFLNRNWQLSRLPKLVKCILVSAIAELFFDKTIDKQIIINDYLEIAKLFNHIGEVGFINSILDKVSLNRDA